MTTYIHYIYIGATPPEQSNAKRFIWSSPIHRVRAGVKTILWCNSEAFEAFKAFKPVTPFGDARNELQRLEEVVNVFPGSIPAGLRAASEVLSRNKCNSALKDMWSLAILYAFGGFFLDASTYLIDYEPSTTPKDLEVRTFVSQFKSGNARTAATTNTQFRPYALGPRFPVLRVMQSPDEKQQQGQEEHVLGPNSVRPGLKLMTPWLEYWAAYANKGDPIVLKMLEVYLRNVLEKMSLPVQYNGWSLDDALSKGQERGLGEEDAKKLRNHVIGQLICSAVKDGLLSSWSGLETAAADEDVRGSAFGGMTWDSFMYKRHTESYVKKNGMTLPSSKWTRVYLPELGLMKRYEGAWR